MSSAGSSAPASPATNSHELEYAIAWFTYHAEQRYQAVFLYVIQLLATPIIAVMIAFLGASEKISLLNFNILGASLILLGALGILISVIFLFLDVRNTELVRVGEDVLEHHEKSFVHTEARVVGVKKTKHPRVDGWKKLGSHSYLLRSFFGLGIIFYACFFTFGWFLFLQNPKVSRPQLPETYASPNEQLPIDHEQKSGKEMSPK